MPNSAAVKAELQALSELEGVHAVALVEADSGMVWFSASEAGDFGSTAEAAIESWRAKTRNVAAFGALGALKLTATHFERGTLIVAPVDDSGGLLLVGQITGGKLNTRIWRERAQAVAAQIQRR